jgi:ADP-ribose pyrophosphatase YjhB (NUDIX family)
VSTSQRPEIQLIVNLVVHDSEGRVLLVKGNTEAERWALPGWELEPYEHPDEGARQLLDDYLRLPEASASLAFVDSFRGRRGWHVTFNYRAEASSDASCERPTCWFELDSFPRTVHGRWERAVAMKALPRFGAPSAPK